MARNIRSCRPHLGARLRPGHQRRQPLSAEAPELPPGLADPQDKLPEQPDAKPIRLPPIKPRRLIRMGVEVEESDEGDLLAGVLQLPRHLEGGQRADTVA